jgi:biopolymer transport protein ExbD
MRLDVGDEDDEVFLNLTPFIDVLFFLVVFFLAATSFAHEEEVRMQLDLPRSAAGKKGEPGHPLVIDVSKEGQIRVDGRVVTIEALKQKVFAAAAHSKEQEILIRGDAQVNFGLVAQAFDVCLQAQLKRVSIAANKAMETAR